MIHKYKDSLSNENNHAGVTRWRVRALTRSGPAVKANFIGGNQGNFIP